ncbi:lipopolysaccharide biosynthesis protein [Spirosoma aerolatum]|uniref:lipopolysaccharide biosynthesis protein n=1 Tax=Spirosoma aerolatum TaxID=1211326 RepID=UPI0009AE4374|nr:lipopolysaccharide biosynthesis protein [Spirosoma aerolatum]
MSVKDANLGKAGKGDEIEIRLSDIIQFLKDSRKTVFYWGMAFLVLGILYAFSQKNEYTTIVKVMPELKTTGTGAGLGDLKSIASLAGVNLGTLGSASEAIRPDLYPDIVQSLPFTLHLLKQPVTTVEITKPQSLQNYLLEESHKGIFSFLRGSDNDAMKGLPTATVNVLHLTRQQEELSKQVNSRITADIDKKSGIITITSRMPDAVVAATVAQQTLNYLTSYVTNYRTSKARQQLKFLKNQVNDARKRYEASELQLSAYRDRNRNLFLNTAKIEEQRLQADYILAQSVYGDLSKQLEQARIKVEEEAPVFQVLEPSRIPLKKSGPKRTAIAAVFGILGIILGSAVFFSKHFFNHYKSNRMS